MVNQIANRFFLLNLYISSFFFFCTTTELLDAGYGFELWNGQLPGTRTFGECVTTREQFNKVYLLDYIMNEKKNDNKKRGKKCGKTKNLTSFYHPLTLVVLVLNFHPTLFFFFFFCKYKTKTCLQVIHVLASFRE